MIVILDGQNPILFCLSFDQKRNDPVLESVTLNPVRSETNSSLSRDFEKEGIRRFQCSHRSIPSDVSRYGHHSLCSRQSLRPNLKPRISVLTKELLFSCVTSFWSRCWVIPLLNKAGRPDLTRRKNRSIFFPWKLH